MAGLDPATHAVRRVERRQVSCYWKKLVCDLGLAPRRLGFGARRRLGLAPRPFEIARYAARAGATFWRLAAFPRPRPDWRRPPCVPQFDSNRDTAPPPAESMFIPDAYKLGAGGRQR
jgi:hypothetical protein